MLLLLVKQSKVRSKVTVLKHSVYRMKLKSWKWMALYRKRVEAKKGILGSEWVRGLVRWIWYELFFRGMQRKKKPLKSIFSSQKTRLMTQILIFTIICIYKSTTDNLIQWHLNGYVHEFNKYFEHLPYACHCVKLRATTISIITNIHGILSFIQHSLST